MGFCLLVGRCSGRVLVQHQVSGVRAWDVLAKLLSDSQILAGCKENERFDW